MREEGHDNINMMLGELLATSKAILKQAEKTNGRVTTLEDKVDSLEKTRDQQTGGGIVGWKVLTIAGAALFTIFVTVYLK